MPKATPALLAFNRGEVSRIALARVDIDRMRLSAERMVNWVPKSQGPMRIRPGLQYVGASDGNEAATWIDFVAATDDVALLEITDTKFRVWIDDTLLTRGSVSTAVTNGSFATSASWTDISTGGGAAPAFGGTGLVLDGASRGGVAGVRQQVTVAGADQGDEHALRIIVSRGPVTFRCGSAAGTDDYVSETSLNTGTHSLAFTPTGNFFVEFQSSVDYDRIVTSIAVEAAGTVEVTAPWLAADLVNIRWSQSADVVFVACNGYQQQRIERRGTGRSWSVCDYQSDDGPFTSGRTSDARLKVGATQGNTTLTADRAFFTADHVGALFRLFTENYETSFALGAEGQFTDPIRVSGITRDAATGPDDREFRYVVSGTWVGTLNLQHSDDEDFGYAVTTRAGGSNTEDITGNGTHDKDDGTDNAIQNNLIEFFRVGFLPGNYTSGTATVAMTYEGGGRFGIVRVVSYVSATVVNVEVIRAPSTIQYTSDWREGRWSDARGWPSSVALYEGRLWWAGGARINGSVSDDYSSFDEEVTGDSGPIDRTFGEGPVDVINFLLPLQHLIGGTAGQEISIRSSSFDEPLTPTNMSAKDCSTQGSRAGVRAVKVDNRGIFAQRAGERVYELAFDVNANDYASVDMTALHPDLARSNPIVDIAVQRQPDTRVHLVLTDGTVAMLTYQPTDEVTCWSRVETDGVIEKAVVLPGDSEDAVYYHVKRTINGSTVRYLEKWAMESETLGETVCKLADSFVTYSGAAATSIPVAHLEAEQVVVWADGAPVLEADGEPKLHTVASGAITLSTAAADVVAGLAYTAQYKSSKLAYAAVQTALLQRKRVDHVGVIAQNMHNKALRFGKDFTTMYRLPDFYKGANVATTVHEDYDIDASAFGGEWDTDSRLCIEAEAPFPVTLMAAVITMATHDKM